MLPSNAKAVNPGNPLARWASNRHRKQGKGRMDQHPTTVRSQEVAQPEEIADES